MKKMIPILAIFICSLMQAQVNIKVEVSGLKSDKGQVMIGLYNSEKQFLKTIYKGSVAAIKDNKAKTTFSNLPKGEYAVSVFHDENGNGKLDTNFMGIPKEDYGASNDAKGFMGPPKYRDAKFIADEDKVIPIKI